MKKERDELGKGCVHCVGMGVGVGSRGFKVTMLVRRG